MTSAGRPEPGQGGVPLQFAGQAPDIAAYAAYIRDMLFELRSMAEKSNMVVLAYFLDMAHEEASLRARRLDEQI